MEEKRFTIIPSKIIEGNYVINDKYSKYVFNPTENKAQLQTIVNALNDLFDENQQLKYENVELKDNIDMMSGNRSWLED